jgi:hypothetical protein
MVPEAGAAKFVGNSTAATGCQNVLAIRATKDEGNRNEFQCLHHALPPDTDLRIGGPSRSRSCTTPWFKAASTCDEWNSS